jgi:MauM/NapG family ferredoxin protein
MAGFLGERIEEALTSAAPKLLRPPGALDELAFLATCTRCDKCLPACPQEAIRKAAPGTGLSVGTPYIEPRSMPCFLCTELPCIPACPEGALVWPHLRIGNQKVDGPMAVRMGTARVRASLCLTYAAEGRAAEECRICVDRCPYPGEAIRMGEAQGTGLPHPEVDAEHCTGCGLCVFACPASGPAIVVDPRR